MAYNITMPQAYAQTNYTDMPQQKKSNSAPVFGMMTVGALGGGTVGYLMSQRTFNSDGKARDSYVKTVSDNLLKLDNKTKELQEQISNILKKIDSIKDSAELKKLLDKNKEAAKLICNRIYSSVDDIVKIVNSENIKATKEAIKNGLKSSNELMRQYAKNIAEKCWDKDTKSFVKPDNIKQKIFDVVKNTKTQNQWKKAIKYGGITACVFGALTLAYKMMGPARYQ